MTDSQREKIDSLKNKYPSLDHPEILTDDNCDVITYLFLTAPTETLLATTDKITNTITSGTRDSNHIKEHPGFAKAHLGLLDALLTRICEFPKIPKLNRVTLYLNRANALLDHLDDHEGAIDPICIKPLRDTAEAWYMQAHDYCQSIPPLGEKYGAEVKHSLGMLLLNHGNKEGNDGRDEALPHIFATAEQGHLPSLKVLTHLLCLEDYFTTPEQGDAAIAAFLKGGEARKQKGVDDLIQQLINHGILEKVEPTAPSQELASSTRAALPEPS